MVKTYSLQPAVVSLNKIQLGIKNVMTSMAAPSLTLPNSRAHHVKCPQGFHVRYTPKKDGDPIEATVLPGVEQGNDEPFSEYHANGTIFWCGLVDEPNIRNKGTFVTISINASADRKLLKIEYHEPTDLSTDEYDVASNKIDALASEIQMQCGFKKRPNYVLCLSGGGLRALFFHLGVVCFLNKCGALKYTSKIFSVSGGSILSAHMLAHWHRYTGNSVEFEEIADSLISRIAPIDIRGSVLRRDYVIISLMISFFFILPTYTFYKLQTHSGLFIGFGIMILLVIIYYYWFVKWLRSSRIKRLRATYNKVYNDAKFREITGKNSEQRQKLGKPEVHFLTTGLRTGAMVAFCDGQLVVSRPFDGSHDDDFGGKRISPKVQQFPLTEGFQLADAVTASSAYPPLFPPLDLVVDSKQYFDGEDHVENGDLVRPDTFLSDGGVFDNLGLRSYSVSQEVFSEAVDCVFACDAGNPLSVKNEKPRGMLSLALRSIEILMDRISTLERINAARGGVSVKNISIYKKSGDYPVSEAAQQTLGKIRTDLDRFSPEEVFALTSHGFNVAKKLGEDLIMADDTETYSELWVPEYCKDFKVKPEGDPIADQKNLFRERVERETIKGSRRKIGIFSFTKPLPCLASVLAILSPIGACYFIFETGSKFSLHAITKKIRSETQNIFTKKEAVIHKQYGQEIEALKGRVKEQSSSLDLAKNVAKEQIMELNEKLTELEVAKIDLEKSRSLLSEYRGLPPEIFEILDNANELDMPVIQQRILTSGNDLAKYDIKEIQIKKRGEVININNYKRIYIWYLVRDNRSELFFIGNDFKGSSDTISGFVRAGLFESSNISPIQWAEVSFRLNGGIYSAFIKGRGYTVSMGSSGRQ